MDILKKLDEAALNMQAGQAIQTLVRLNTGIVINDGLCRRLAKKTPAIVMLGAIGVVINIAKNEKEKTNDTLTLMEKMSKIDTNECERIYKQVAGNDNQLRYWLGLGMASL